MFSLHEVDADWFRLLLKLVGSCQTLAQCSAISVNWNEAQEALIGRRIEALMSTELLASESPVRQWDQRLIDQLQLMMMESGRETPTTHEITWCHLQFHLYGYLENRLGSKEIGRSMRLCELYSLILQGQGFAFSDLRWLWLRERFFSFVPDLTSFRTLYCPEGPRLSSIQIESRVRRLKLFVKDLGHLVFARKDVHGKVLEITSVANIFAVLARLAKREHEALLIYSWEGDVFPELLEYFSHGPEDEAEEEPAPDTSDESEAASSTTQVSAPSGWPRRGNANVVVFFENERPPEP